MKSATLLLLSTCMGILRAQDLTTKEFGLIGGPSLTSLRIEKGLFTEAHTYKNNGFASGIYFHRNINSKFSLRAECLYEFKSARVQCLVMNEHNGNYIEEEVIGIMRFHSISLPILAKYNFGLFKMFFIESGPVISRITNSEISVPPAAKMPAQVWDLSDQISKLEMGWAAGFGLENFVSSNLILSLRVRDHLGLTNVFDNNSRLVTRSNATYLLVGLAYRISTLKEAASEPRRLY